MDDILAQLGWLLIEFVLIGTGRFVVTAATLGRWRGERPVKGEGRVFGAAGALSFVRDGQRVVTSIGLLFIGAVFYVGLLVLLVWAA